MNTEKEGKAFVWLDDLRDPKDFGFPEATWIKDPQEAIRLARSGQIARISFDHDLGVFLPDGSEITGAEVAKAIEEMAFHGEIGEIPEWRVHSANPEGRKRIEAAMRSAERFEASRRESGNPSPRGFR